MSRRDSRGTLSDRRPSQRRGSVVGSTVRDVSSRLEGRGLPRGGIRERDGLKVAEGGRPDSTLIGAPQAGRGRARRALHAVAIVSGVLAVFLFVAAVALMVLSHTGAFEVTAIEAYDSEHITADQIAKLAAVPEGTTLLSVDVGAIENGVLKNPWVASVKVQRVFPDTLRLTVQERSVAALVAMGNGGLAWYLGNDDVWIEPAHFEDGDTSSFSELALAEAQSLGVVLISDLPASVQPVAGSVATDKPLLAVREYLDGLSGDFKDMVVCYSAASGDDISCVLSNGVEVAFGTTASIGSKESVAKRILEEYEGQVTYINVRIPSHPTYRRVDSGYVREGTGATGSMVEGGNNTQEPAAQEAGDPGASPDDEAQGGAAATTSSAGTGDASGIDDGSGTYGTYGV